MTVKIHLISLGCSKNLVDSEMMLGILNQHHFTLVNEPAAAQIIIINTCGFIDSAKAEAIETILAMAEYKKQSCQYLIVTGCLVERYRAEILAEIPEIDGVLGVQEYHLITELIDGLHQKLITNKGVAPKPLKDADLAKLYSQRQMLTMPHTAYLKITEGCNNNCTYCAIPQIRGPLQSRTQVSLVQEAQMLYQRGVKEIILIGQDTTSYGQDLVGKSLLADLLADIAQIGFAWVRVLYSYPTRVGQDVLNVMAKYPNICHYLDIPLQHTEDPVLEAMHRFGKQAEIIAELKMIRQTLPDIALRTTVMVGFPGETNAQWQRMLKFLAEAQFTWVGVFKYSPEEHTKACSLKQITERTKEKRYHATLEALSVQSYQTMQKWLGQTLIVLVEALSDDGQYYLGRSQYHSPDVDGLVLIEKNGNLNIGSMVPVKITATDIYDLIGVIDESAQ